MSITISYQLTQDDYYEFYYFTSWKAQWNKKRRSTYFLQAFLFGLALIFIMVYSFERKNLTNIISSILVFYAIYIVLLLIIIKDGYRRTSRKIYEDPKNSNLFLKSDLRFDEAGIFSKNEISESLTRWDAVIKSSITAKHYFLYFSEMNALTIPKRVFKSVSEKESFEKMLAQYLSLQADLPLVNK